MRGRRRESYRERKKKKEQAVNREFNPTIHHWDLADVAVREIQTDRRHSPP